MVTYAKHSGRGIVFVAALVGAGVIGARPSHAVSPDWAAAIGVGSFALGATIARPYYGYPAYGYGYGGYPAYGYGLELPPSNRTRNGLGKDVLPG
jgi:hypothetical protein